MPCAVAVMKLCRNKDLGEGRGAPIFLWAKLPACPTRHICTCFNSEHKMPMTRTMEAFTSKLNTEKKLTRTNVAQNHQVAQVAPSHIDLSIKVVHCPICKCFQMTFRSEVYKDYELVVLHSMAHRKVTEPFI